MVKISCFAATCLIITMSNGAARAADVCNAVALRDVIDVDGSSSPSLKKGEIMAAVTQYRISEFDGRTSICAHGGGCHPIYSSYESGLTLNKQLDLTNCTIDRGRESFEEDDTKYGGDKYIVYGLKPDPIRISATDLRYDRIDNRLSELGLCVACAAHVATRYIRAPNSPCGRLALSALEGDPDAIDKLRDGPLNCSGNIQ